MPYTYVCLYCMFIWYSKDKNITKLNQNKNRNECKYNYIHSR